MFNTDFLEFLLHYCESVLNLLIWKEVISHFLAYLLIFLININYTYKYTDYYSFPL